MKTQFTKYSCQGNDFVLIDHLKEKSFDVASYSSHLISALCDRKKGIGADGVLLMAPDSSFDFKMIYFNADGNEVEMCGNGSRAMVAHFLEHHAKDHSKDVSFSTLNGSYQGAMGDDGRVKVQMTELEAPKMDLLKDYEKKFQAKKSFYLKVGVPHAIFEVEDLDKIDLENWGRTVRFDSRFPQGTNVNFFKIHKKGHLEMRTYERGVEGETLACGTGATAVAEVYRAFYEDIPSISLLLKGGEVILERDQQSRRFLCGHVSRVFEGLYFPGALGIE